MGSCYTCPATVASTNALTSNQFSFSGISSTLALGVTTSSTSSNLYFLYQVFSPGPYAVIRKVNSADTVAWMAAVVFWPIIKSVVVSANEQYVFFGSASTPLNVIRLSATSGVIIDQQQYTSLSSQSHDTRIHPLSDNTGYYVTGNDGSYNNICRYLFASPGSPQCQQISSFLQNSYGQLKLSDTSLFLIGADYTTTNLHLYRITFSVTTVNWATKMVCPTSACAATYSESLLATDTTKFYTFFVYGNPKYLYFMTISSADGSVVSSRYKSSTTCSQVYGTALNGGYVLATACDNLLIMDTTSYTFTTKSSGTVSSFQCGAESTGRFIVIGALGVNGYFTRFMPSSINVHPDFTTAAWTMNLLSTGTDDIVSDSGQTIGSVSNPTISSSAFSNQSVTYVAGTSYVSDVYYQVNSQTYTYNKNVNVDVTPDLPCAPSGTPTIAYSLSAYNGNTVPSWLSIGSSTGLLSIATPNLSSDTSYSFYISSLVTGLASSVNKIVTVSVFTTCSVTNCLTCSNTDSTICIACNTGYTLGSNTCTAVVTPTVSPTPTTTTSRTPAINTDDDLRRAANVEQTFTTILLVVVIVTTALTTAAGETSSSSMWCMVNQIQLFFLLLLTRAFIPDPVIKVIVGNDFALNPFESIAFLKTKKYGSWTYNLVFDLNNSSLEYFDMNSRSTLYNAVSFFTTLSYAVAIHILLYPLILLISKWTSEGKLARLIKHIIKRIFDILTFSYYIRLFIEFGEYIVVSAVNEVYVFDTSRTLQIISLCFAIFIIVISLLWAILALILSLSSYKINEKEHNKLDEFFNGLKLEKRFRAYVVITMARRFVYIVFLITLASLPSKTVIGILVGLQVIYFIHVAIVRPYDEIQTNLIEIINEFAFILLLGSLIVYNTENDWTVTFAYIYIQVLVLTSLIDFIIIQVFVIRTLWIKFRNKFLKKKTAKVLPNSVDQIQSIEAIAQNKSFAGIAEDNMNAQNVSVYEENKEEEVNDGFQRQKTQFQDP